MMRFLVALLVGLAVLAGCTTVPQSVALPRAGVRVISFAMERGVPVGNLNAPLEPRPGFLNTANDTFEVPLVATIAGLWKAFPEQAARLGGSWEGPGSEAEHPHWVAASSQPISSSSLDWGRARGLLWPEGFRFVDASGAAISDISADYPGQLMLVVEYRLFVEDVGGTTEFGYPDYRMGLAATLTLYDSAGTQLTRDELVGYSQDKASRYGATVNRARYADLALQAQADVLRKWGQRVRFSS